MPDPTDPPAGLALSPALFLFTLALYVALGYALKSIVLNWVVGPLFPLVTLYLIPAAARRVVGRGRGS